MSPNIPVSPRQAFTRMLWIENPVAVQILGICSALAVTNLVKNTLVMCAGLMFATAMSTLTVSILRNLTPRRVRMMTQIAIIAAYVIVIQIVLDAFLPEVAKRIGPYVGLIITNCIIMGRCEAFASSNKPGLAFLDGLGAGLGYTLVLLPIAMVREPLGLGTFFGYKLVGPEQMTFWNIMVIAPAGFFGLASFIWLARVWGEWRAKNARPGAPAGGK